MATFALIAEGKTDQVILERIIEHMCEDSFSDGVDVNFLQPLRDETDSQKGAFAGWELVIEYCKNHFDDALATNDIVVVHIDTDKAEHPNFGVPLTNGGVDRPFSEVVNDTQQMLISHIGAESFNLYSSRIVFAISIHSIESWILLVIYDRDEVKNSFDRLNRELIRKDEEALVKDARRYGSIAKLFKKKRLVEIRSYPGSLSVFQEDLAKLGFPAQKAV